MTHRDGSGRGTTTLGPGHVGPGTGQGQRNVSHDNQVDGRRPSTATPFDRVRDGLQAIGLAPEAVAEHRLMVELTGQWRRGLPVMCTVEERHLRIAALLAGAVEEKHAEVYAFLLSRNERAGDVYTALDGDGDVLLVARLPLSVVDPPALDELFGELLTVADETFNTVLGTGFASYVEREQRWRELRDQPDNPAFPTGRPA